MPVLHSSLPTKPVATTVPDLATSASSSSNEAVATVTNTKSHHVMVVDVGTPTKSNHARHHHHNHHVGSRSPYSAGVVSLGSSTDSITSEEAEDDEDTLAHDVKQIFKTAHKLKEESGEYPVEPLLKENPNRFVLFPIQDDEVRTKLSL
jgi:hypothetical protein